MKKAPRLVFIALALVGVSAIAGVLVQFDINDKGTSSPSAAGGTGVTGTAADADTVTGTVGTHTLALATSGDGQDRDPGTGNFTTDSNLGRDFGFVSTPGAPATATLTGLVAKSSPLVTIRGYQKASPNLRSAIWTDTVSGNSGISFFDVATSLNDSATTIPAATDSAGERQLSGVAAANESDTAPNILVSDVSVSSEELALTTIQAESGTLGAQFSVNTLASATGITISPTGGGNSPGSAARVVSYSVTFPKADTYQLYARIYVGSDTFNDDSFFYGTSFGAKSPTTIADWITVNGLASGGFTAATDTVTVGGGAAGNLVWKWVKFGTSFTVSAGALTQTFQIGGREDGFTMDKFVFASANVSPTVADLDSGLLPTVTLSPNFFVGPDGIAIHRFDERLNGLNRDGANPAGSLTRISGALYGLTLNGGMLGDGTMFKVNPDGASFATLRDLSDAADVGNPQGGFAVSGSNLYGASQTGGANHVGTVFSAAADGSATVIRSFAALAAHTATNTGGAFPCETLALSAGGILYGTTAAGGANANGTVYAIATNGTGFIVLHDFTALNANTGVNADGAQPTGGVILSGATLYGTTSSGGVGGAGVVFSLNVNGSSYTVLHSFAAPDPLTAVNADGAFPLGGLVLSNGVLYGTTNSGGASGRGTVFSVKVDGAGFAVLHDFPATDSATGTNVGGASPSTGLTLSGNVLYGVTPAGGGGGTGTVFAVNITGENFRPLHSFEALAADGKNAYGAFPVAPVLRAGNFVYGTTFAGGPGASGTVFGIEIPKTTFLSVASSLSVGFDVTLIGLWTANSSYLVQASGDLIFWQNLGAGVTDADGNWQFTEQSQTSPARFYRAVFTP